MAEPIIVDYIPELTGARQPSRLRSMQDNIPEESPRGGTATAEKPKEAKDVYTKSLDDVENKIVKDYLEDLDERIEKAEVEVEDLKREYKSLRKLVALVKSQDLMDENASRAAASRRQRLVNKLTEKGLKNDEVVQYLARVDSEIIREQQELQEKERLDAVVRREKGYSASKQVTEAERREQVQKEQQLRRQLQNEQLRRQGYDVPEEDDVEEDDQEETEEEAVANDMVRKGGISARANDRALKRARKAITQTPDILPVEQRHLRVRDSNSPYERARLKWIEENEGKALTPEQEWQFLQKERLEEGLKSVPPTIVKRALSQTPKQGPSPKDMREFDRDYVRANKDPYGGKLPSSIQDWLETVISKQDEARYGPEGTTPLYLERDDPSTPGAKLRVVQPQNVLEWFREQMLNADSQAGDENAVNFWSIGPTLGTGSSVMAIERMQNYPGSFFKDESTGVVYKQLLDAMVLEVWQANAARNLFQVNDFLKESDSQFFEQFGKVMLTNFLTKPAAINLFALAGVDPKFEMDPKALTEGGKGFENQQTGQAIRAALLTYGYLGDMETLESLWGKDSAMLNNKEFVKSYHAIHWDRQKSEETFNDLPQNEKVKAGKQKYLKDEMAKVPKEERHKWDQGAFEKRYNEMYNQMSEEEKSAFNKNAYLHLEELAVINKARSTILVADAVSTDLDDIVNNAYNKNRPEYKDTVKQQDAGLNNISEIFNADGSIKDKSMYIEHVINMFREAIPFNEIRTEIQERIVYSLTQGGQVQVENPDYNPRYIVKNGLVIDNPKFDPDKPIDKNTHVSQFDAVTFTSAKYGVRIAQYLEPLWLHEQDPSGRAQRAGAKLTRNERNAVRSGEDVRLGTPGNVASIGTMRVLGASPLEAILDQKGYSIAERLRGSNKGKVNINLRRKISADEVYFPKDAMKAYQGDFFKRGASLYDKRTKGSLFSGLASAVKRDFFQGIITDHHKIDELIHDGIGKDIQYFVSTYGGIDYSKEERVRDETSKGKYETISNAERFYGYDVLDRDKFHMKIADTAYIDEINRRIHGKYHNLHGEEFEKARAEELAKLPRNKYGEILVHDGKEPEHGHGEHHGDHHEVAIQRYGDRKKYGTYKWKEIDEKVKHHGHDAKNAWGQTRRRQGRQHMIDAQLVQNVDRRLLWKEVLKAEIANSLIEHRMRASGHEYFDWEASQRIIDLLRYIPANAEQDPVTGKYHYHGTLFSKEDVDWIQKRARMGHLMRGEIFQEGRKELLGGIFELLNQIMAYTFK